MPAGEDKKLKEGVDFEYRTVKTKDGKTAYKNRHVFTPSEKAAMAAPKKATSVAQPKTKAAPKKPAEKPVTKDAMKGYRPGDVTTSKITPSGGRGDGSAERVRRAADTALNRVKKQEANDVSKIPVPGRAIVRAVKNAWNGKGETDAAKISSRGYAKGGMVKKACKTCGKTNCKC